MRTNLVTTCAMAALAVGASQLPAQLPVGVEAPGLDVKQAFNDAPSSWTDTRGKAVLVKFSRTW